MLSPLLWGEEALEIVNSYTYLGVLFSSSRKFKRASKAFTEKGLMATAKTREVLNRSKTDSIEARMALLNSAVKSTVLYCSEIWALRYHEKLERVQTSFIKSLYHLAKNTPNYYIWQEFGLLQLSKDVFERALTWWFKLLDMEDDRLPK